MMGSPAELLQKLTAQGPVHHFWIRRLIFKDLDFGPFDRNIADTQGLRFAGLACRVASEVVTFESLASRMPVKNPAISPKAFEKSALTAEPPESTMSLTRRALRRTALQIRPL